MTTKRVIPTQLDRLAGFDSGPFPVISLYLNMQPDEHGRDHFEPFLRKELGERIRTYATNGPERDSLQQDSDKIRAYLTNVEPSVNGLALFACAGTSLFEPLTLAAPVNEHRLYISDQPHLYPLARLLDAYPRYAVLLADTNSARLFVVASNAVQQSEEVHGTKTKRHKMGGWSQARYQRHVDNYHLHHAKEVVDALARVVRDESIASIIIAGDEVIVPLLKEQLPKEVAERVVDFVKLDIRAPEHEVLETSLTAIREKDAITDRERVDALFGAYRANGLAVVGLKDTSRALDMGQADELVVTSLPGTSGTAPGSGKGSSSSSTTPLDERAADELVVKARQTAATIRFIEDASLLASVGGVGAFLRFKL